ncbi:hypothetical protein Ahy_B09g095962 isoform B [Arachis hypogaea]|uniref:BED-type domain-containing protein n=1 Tax=Arachis hypogaea TaxID=3818 RepID=A0A444XHD9_ARAHY|nr:hypothetical protein Ahy_B09g095962 isoform B [Arachis hypogaea]
MEQSQNDQQQQHNARQESQTASSRGKSDPAWEYFTVKYDKNNKAQYTCIFCLNTYNGGGIYRMKYHLAKIPGQIKVCSKVTEEVELQFKRILMENKKNKMEKRKFEEEAYGGEAHAQEAESPNPIQAAVPTTTGDKGKRRAVVATQIGSYFKERTTPGSQPTLRSVLASKEIVHKAKLGLAKWIVDARISFNAIQSPYFQPALDGVAAIGPGFKGPSYDEMRVHLLADLKRECQLLVEKYRSSWKSTGCTLMADGWTDQRQRTLINFLVYCPAGMSFVKTVDASDVIKTANALFNLFADVIEWVGPSNIVHVVTDNAANYVSARKLIHEKYPNIFWSPYAAHCINLILKDIASIPHISDLASRASKVTVFVYNHMILLSWLRKRKSWTEIVRPGVTRFATVFITLKSIYDHKVDLQTLMVDQYFTSHKLSKSANGKMVSSIVLDSKFWQDCLTTVKIVGPLIKLLRLVDADEKPSLGIVYEGMQRAKKAIKTMFRNRKAAYTPYTSILKMRWDKHLKRDLHAAAYFLNPGIFYSEGFVEKANVLRSLLDLLDVETLCDDSVATMQEIQLYRDCKESFGRESAKRAASRLEPVDFWVMADEDDPKFTNGDVEGIESLIYTDNAMPSYPNDGGDMEVEVDMPDVVIESSNTSFGDISEDAGFGLPVYDGDIGTLNDDYDF